MNNSRLHQVYEGTTPAGTAYKIYEFLPSLFRQFYQNLEKQTLRRRIRFFLEWIKGYRVYYLSVDDTITAYSVVSVGGGRYSFAGKKDIVVGPYFVLEQFRGKRYSELLVNDILNHLNLPYNAAYDWIRKGNTPSLRCSRKVGFEIEGTMDIVGPFRRLILRDGNSGEYYLLKYTRADTCL